MVAPISVKGLKTSGATILVVDDEPDLRAIVAEILTESGNTVIEAQDGKVACSLLETESVDLIITDIVMPVMDGVGLVRWASEHRPEIPVLAISAHASIRIMQDLLRLHVYDFLEKPFTGEVLANRVQQALDLGKLKAMERLLTETIFASIDNQKLKDLYNARNIKDRYDALKKVIAIFELKRINKDSKQAASD